MTAWIQNIRSTLSGENSKVHFNWRYFIQDHITRSFWLALWLLALTIYTLTYVAGQLQAAPITSAIILILWIVTVTMMIRAEVYKDHNQMTLWLKENLYSSITNALISLLLTLIIIAAIRGFWSYAIADASFSLDPDVNALDTSFGREGARWGAVRANLANLLVFRLKDQVWRVWSTLAMVVVLAIPSFIVFRNENYRNHWLRRTLLITWIFTPFMGFYFLRGFGPQGDFRIIGFILAAVLIVVGLGVRYYQNRYGEGQDSPTWRILNPLLGLIHTLAIPLLVLYVLATYSGSGPFHEIDIDQMWGGLLLTMVISIFAIVVSFPLGVVLALGRRSNIQGVPWWITYPVAAVATLLLLADAPGNAERARTTLGAIVAYWPVLIPVIAYGFQHGFKGNVVAMLSTVYIEFIRGVPLITLLFAAVILFGIFLPPGWELIDVWLVCSAFALFSAAYLAENVRGGLQAIPKGQYEAADSLGLSTVNKYRLIIMPQALRIVIPAIVGQFIGLFKDTSLVYLVGLFDFLNVANGISAQPDWLTIRTEPYIFLLIVYFLIASVMAWYSRRLERQLGVGQN